MFCAKCGSKVEEGQCFCRKCGASMSSGPSETPNAQSTLAAQTSENALPGSGKNLKPLGISLCVLASICSLIGIAAYALLHSMVLLCVSGLLVALPVGFVLLRIGIKGSGRTRIADLTLAASQVCAAITIRTSYSLSYEFGVDPTSLIPTRLFEFLYPILLVIAAVLYFQSAAEAGQKKQLA